MAQQYTKEQFWKLYEKLPQELKDALFAEETGDNIYETCKRNGVESHLEEIVDLTGQVLVGLLPPQDFSKALQDLKIKKDTAEKVAREINRFVFYPVRPALEKLHRMEIGTSEKDATTKLPAKEEEEIKEPQPPKGPDTYREPLE